MWLQTLLFIPEVIFGFDEVITNSRIHSSCVMSRRVSPDRDVASRRNRIVKHIRRQGTVVVSDGNMAWRSLCAKHNVRNEEVAQQVKEFTQPLPVQHQQKKCRRWRTQRVLMAVGKALKAYLPKKKLLTDPITKSLSPFTPSPCMGLAKKLGTLECCRFLGPLDQNLVKVRLVYPDYAEKKKYDKYVCRHGPQTKTRNPCNCCDLIATHTPSEYHFSPRPNMSREPSCR